MLKTIAIARLNDANSNILVTTALETLDPTATHTALLGGANSLMINLTPHHLRKLYAIYDHRAGVHEEIGARIQAVISLLTSLGRAPTDISVAENK